MCGSLGTGQHRFTLPPGGLAADLIGHSTFCTP
ncbi:hypothetical protein E2C01_099778 [Portunus trituberculatus]|uniref:Uncharacterized protein n=1 Tax=Portunus trituberculatus TaxID=210409 RepID=A0A5B7KBT1_PORTR|nr:hypothetical protein [Portunus trituberculatus]